MAAEEKVNTPFFRRRPILTLVGVNLLVFMGLALAAELVLRWVVAYHPGYYTAVTTESGRLTYPWGYVPVNAMGFADTPFVLGDRPRIAYLGDSVNFGVGAGYGYRISELLEARFPQYDHWNLGGIGQDSSAEVLAEGVEVIRELRINRVIYLLNLNDIVPDRPSEQERRVIKGSQWVRRNLDRLRGKSFLYTWVRGAVKKWVTSGGYEASGYHAVELFPSNHADVFQQTAARLTAFHQALDQMGVALDVVLLPYEMQISNRAAQRYHELGFEWESGFENGLAQARLTALLPKQMTVVNALDAFHQAAGGGAWRDRFDVGEVYVYDKGDKIDWNHPNREGHRIIADYLAQRLTWD